MYVYGIAYTYLSIILSWFATEYIPTYLHIDIFNHNKKKSLFTAAPDQTFFSSVSAIKIAPVDAGHDMALVIQL